MAAYVPVKDIMRRLRNGWIISACCMGSNPDVITECWLKHGTDPWNAAYGVQRKRLHNSQVLRLLNRGKIHEAFRGFFTIWFVASGD